MSNLTSEKPRLMDRINFRLILFVAVVATPILWIMYTFVRSEVTHGISDAGAGYKLVDLKAMSTFEFDPVRGSKEDVPAIYRQLDGQKVILDAEIAPTQFSSNSLGQFDLVYSVTKCCFSGKPLVQHFVQSRMRDGTKAPYYSGLVRVKGVLHVNIQRSDDEVTSIYQLDVESVDPA